MLFRKSKKKITLFVAFVLQYPMSPNFTYLNDVVEVDVLPNSKPLIGELENLLRQRVMSNMISDDKSIRLTIISFHRLEQ